MRRFVNGMNARAENAHSEHPDEQPVAKDVEQTARLMALAVAEGDK